MVLTFGPSCNTLSRVSKQRMNEGIGAGIEMKGCREYYGSLLGGVELAISVGDNYKQDIVAPKGLGMRTVWISRQVRPEIAELAPFDRAQYCDSLISEQVYPDAVIVSFTELPMVINEIES